MSYIVRNYDDNTEATRIAPVLRDGEYTPPKYLQKAIELFSEDKVFSDFGYKYLNNQSPTIML